eukprot:6086892-Alexandrium_andersonii.AAC.1
MPAAQDSLAQRGGQCEGGLDGEGEGRRDGHELRHNARKRIRVDEAVDRKYGFRWPAALAPDDTLIGRVERLYTK